MNIYIKAMEIGFENPKGIFYRDLKQKIEEFQGFEFGKEQEFAFVRWLIRSFNTSGHYTTNLEKVLEILHNTFMRRSNRHVEPEYIEIMNSRFFVNGETVKQYLDYIELKESREQSKKAFIYSILSIALAVLSILLSWFLSKDAPQPPYDVKIIEDEVEHFQMHNEIDSLKNELGKAAMMIDIYEENLINEKNRK